MISRQNLGTKFWLFLILCWMIIGYDSPARVRADTRNITPEQIEAAPESPPQPGSEAAVEPTPEAAVEPVPESDPDPTPAVEPERVPEAGQESYAEQLNNLIQLKNPNPPFAVKLWVNKEVFNIGEIITFSFQSERNCYLTLIDITTNGEINVIFPNQFHQDNFIRSGRTYTIPDPEYDFDFQIDGPVGWERVKIIASLDPLKLFKHNFTRSAFTSIPGNQTRTISVISKKIENLEQDRWAEAHLDFQIKN